MFRNRKKSAKEYVQATTISKNTGMNHFKQLYQAISTNNISDETTSNFNSPTCEPIKVKYVETTVQKFKNRKSSGRYGIAYEMLEYGGIY